MAAKGTVAKTNVTKKIQEVFGKDFIGEYDKKIYVWADDGGERVQIAIAMTCPKNPVAEIKQTSMDFGGGGLDFEKMGDSIVAPKKFEPAEISEEEKKNIADIMARLGL